MCCCCCCRRHRCGRLETCMRCLLVEVDVHSSGADGLVPRRRRQPTHSSFVWYDRCRCQGGATLGGLSLHPLTRGQGQLCTQYCSASRLSLRPLLVDLPCTITTVVATQTTNRRRGQDVMSKQALMLLSLLAVICAHYRCVTDRGCASSATRAHAINLEHVLHTSRGVSTVPSGRSNWMPLSSSVPRDSEGDTHTRCVTRMVA